MLNETLRTLAVVTALVLLAPASLADGSETLTNQADGSEPQLLLDDVGELHEFVLEDVECSAEFCAACIIVGGALCSVLGGPIHVECVDDGSGGCTCRLFCITPSPMDRIFVTP